MRDVPGIGICMCCAGISRRFEGYGSIVKQFKGQENGRDSYLVSERDEGD